MKSKHRIFLSILTIYLLTFSSARAAETFEGTVVPGEIISLTAPYGGTLKSTALRAGSSIQVGDAIAVMETTKVLASEDGTIRGVFAQEGDSAEQTVLYLSPVSKFTINASIGKAYDSVDAKYVTLGEKVYIKCASDGSHKAIGVITSVSGSSYVVQATAGELYMEETVYLYRTPDYDSQQRIGSGTVSRTEAVAVSGKGSLLKLHVQDGDVVERGQLLFETVEGAIDALISPGSTILSTADGVVAEIRAQAGQKVSKGDVLLTVYQTQDYQVEFSIPEDMLPIVSAGESAEIYFNWNEDKQICFPGTVTEISYVSRTSEETGEVIYSGYIAFEPDETVRLGMNVSVMLDE